MSPINSTEDNELLRLDSGINLFGPSPTVKDAISEALNEVELYPNLSAKRLRSKLADFHNLNPDQIHLGNGIDGILHNISQTFLRKGKSVITAEHTYPLVSVYCNARGANNIVVPLKDFRHDLTAMRKVITDDTKLIYLCNPSYPTGTIFTHSELERFLENIPKKCIVVIDEALHEFATSDVFPYSVEFLKNYDNLILMRTFSKAYGLAGLRIGYSLQNPKLTDKLEKNSQLLSISILTEKATIAALEDQAHINHIRMETKEIKNILVPLLHELGFKLCPSEANFIFAYNDEPLYELVRKLKEEGVYLRSLQGLGLDKAVQITISPRSGAEKLIRGLKSALT
jgi:histidinol-phosphate aminotransferase